jgi:two-component system NtrC family sensor kinase
MREERQRIEFNLESAQGRFQSIYESSKDAIVYVSLKGHQQDVNEAMLKLTRYLKDQLLSMAYHELTAQEYRDEETDAIQHVISSGQPMEYEKKIIRRDGCRVRILPGAFIVQAGDEMQSGLAMISKMLPRENWRSGTSLNPDISID